jgi:hypothetical protein
MTAQVYRQMHDRFHVANDMATARTMYLELADTYPGHRLADDALFEAAALTGEIKDKASRRDDSLSKDSCSISPG